jgi:hypothetical protein
MALLWRSPFCAIKACNRIHVERDHTRPWATTKLTLLDDLEHLCDHHHDLKSHHGWDVITDGDGDRIMVAPDDPLHPGHAPPGDDLDPATTANPDRDDGQTSDAA